MVYHNHYYWIFGSYILSDILKGTMFQTLDLFHRKVKEVGSAYSLGTVRILVAESVNIYSLLLSPEVGNRFSSENTTFFPEYHMMDNISEIN
jgi:hypothetical protein